MKSVEKAIERFCYKHPKFGIKKLMLIIIIGNIIVYFLSRMDTTGTLYYYLCFSPELILHGQVWRLFSFIFMPISTSSILSFAITMYFYFFIGNTLENQWGTAKFSLYYLSGILLSLIYGFVLYALGSGVFSYYLISAYYINMAMFFAFATMWPDMTLYLFFFIPIKIKWLALIDAALFLFDMISGRTLFPLIAILNYFIFCGGTLIERLKRSKGTYKRQTEFKTAVHQAKYEQEHTPYRHKCSVCGRTDTDYPTLQFRYCSRCVGYHCFCEDHINNHVHFTE